MVPPSLSLPRELRAHSFDLPLSQILSQIRDTGSRLKLNKCRFKHIESLCFAMRRAPGLCEGNQRRMLLYSIHTRCQTWKDAGLLESLILVPLDMEKYEQRCERLCIHQTQGTNSRIFCPGREDLAAEQEAIESAIKDIVLMEEHRLRALSLKGNDADAFMTHLLKMLRQSPAIDDTLREEYFKALRILATESGVTPSVLRVKATKTSEFAVAHGGASDVYKGKRDHDGKVVAIKRPRIVASAEGDKTNQERLKRHQLEGVLWATLSHPRILPFIGILEEDGYLHSMVSPWMPNGNLRVFLQKPRNQKANRLEILYQVSLAIKYLHDHKPSVAHGDIKAANVLVDEEGNPLLSDFGASRNYYGIDRTKTSNASSGTERWMSPELLNPTDDEMAKPTLPSDMWSFGMLMQETFTDAIPYASFPDAAVVTMVVVNKTLPERPPSHFSLRGLTDAVWQLMCECWKYSRMDRPDIDYMVRNLARLSRPDSTTRKMCTESELVPTSLIASIITPDDASWKGLNVKVVKMQGYVRHRQRGVQMTVVEITGEVEMVSEARFRIREMIEKNRKNSNTAHISISKELYARVIGEKRCHVGGLEKKYGVQILFPNPDSPSDEVSILGPTIAVEATKEALVKMAHYHANPRGVRKVSSRAAEVIFERRQDYYPHLRSLDVPAGIIKLRRNKKGIKHILDKITNVEEDVAREITDELSVDSLLYHMLEHDPMVWEDIVRRGGGPADPLGNKGFLEMAPNKIKIRGSPEFVTPLRKEIELLNSIGHARVTATKISSHRHKALEKQITSLRDCTGAMAYFPITGGYTYLGPPDNMHLYLTYPAEDIVKIAGSSDACDKAYDYLHDRVEEQRMQEKYTMSMSLPATLHNALRNILQPRFQNLGISLESEAFETPQSILSFFSYNHSPLTAARNWKIYDRRDPEDIPLCVWRLDATSIPKVDDRLRVLAMAREYVTTEGTRIWRRIGVLRLWDASRSRDVRTRLSELCDQDNEMAFELVERPNQAVVVAGPSTAKVMQVFDELIPLVGSSESY